MVKNLKDISAAKVTLEEQGVSTPRGALHPRVVDPGRDLAVKISGDSICQGEMKSLVEKSGALLKDQPTKSHLQVLILGSGREPVAQRKQVSYRERTGGIAAKALVLSPSPAPPTDAIFPGWNISPPHGINLVDCTSPILQIDFL